MKPAVIVLVAFLLTLELSILGWRHRGARPAEGPVFRLPMAENAFGGTPQIVTATRIYQADRGAELKSNDGRHATTVFYFEWDRVQASPVMGLASHGPEMCNTGAGFVLLGRGTRRSYEVPGQPPLEFESTSFTTPAGNPMHVFKMAWMQGIGPLELNPGKNRLTRLRLSLEEKRGSARVLQGGIEGAYSEEEAWRTFRSQVLSAITWNPAAPLTSEL